MITAENRNTKGRGFKRYYYMVNDIAVASGVHDQTVRNAANKGRLDLSDIFSVSVYVLQHTKQVIKI